MLGVVTGCASSRVEHSAAPGPGGADCSTTVQALRRYLGDGITAYHYYPIVDYLRENPGSEANTRAVEQEEREAAKSPADLKPPSSCLIETEFSHLLGAIARDNGGIGAAVFDTTGLKVAASGLTMEGIVLPADRMERLRTAPEDTPLEVQYTCETLRAMSQPGSLLGELAKHCKKTITAYYRPVIDYDHDPRLVGFSLLVVQDDPSCSERRP